MKIGSQIQLQGADSRVEVDLVEVSLVVAVLDLAVVDLPVAVDLVVTAAAVADEVALEGVASQAAITSKPVPQFLQTHSQITRLMVENEARLFTSAM